MSQKIEASNKVPIKYGELIVLGSDGAEDTKKKTKSRFALCQRPEANGLRTTRGYMGSLGPRLTHLQSISCPGWDMGGNQPVSVGDQPCISFIRTLDEVMVEYSRDRFTDMFQIGRSQESHIDFTVKSSACRIFCHRSPPHIVHIYAGAFDSSNNIDMGENTVNWRAAHDGQMDGLTTNGVLVKRPSGPWREISLRGHAFAPREPRNDPYRGRRMDGHELVQVDGHELVDGSLIDLCGVTLLWRTAEGLMAGTPTATEVNGPRLHRNAAVHCSTAFQRATGQYFFKCGHQIYREASTAEAEAAARKEERECPKCGVRGPFKQMQLLRKLQDCN